MAEDNWDGPPAGALQALETIAVEHTDLQFMDSDGRSRLRRLLKRDGGKYFSHTEDSPVLSLVASTRYHSIVIVYAFNSDNSYHFWNGPVKGRIHMNGKSPALRTIDPSSVTAAKAYVLDCPAHVLVAAKRLKTKVEGSWSSIDDEASAIADDVGQEREQHASIIAGAVWALLSGLTADQLCSLHEGPLRPQLRAMKAPGLRLLVADGSNPAIEAIKDAGWLPDAVTGALASAVYASDRLSGRDLEALGDAVEALLAKIRRAQESPGLNEVLEEINDANAMLDRLIELRSTK